MTQSQVKINTALFCDLKTDEEKSIFFLSGRGYETGVIAQAIQNDVAMAYHRCSEYRKDLKALQALQAELAELKQTSLFAAGYRFGRDANDAGHTVRLQKEKDALQAECENLRKDAERYRWLREAHTAHPINLTICSANNWGLEPWSGDDPDEAIDRARRIEGES